MPTAPEKPNGARKIRRLKRVVSLFFGIKFAALMAAWEDYRIPVDSGIVRPEDHPDHRKENELFWRMPWYFQTPGWATAVIFAADAVFAAKADMKLIQDRDQDDPWRRWGFVSAVARTRNMAEGKSLKNLVEHTPHRGNARTWIARRPARQKRKTFWISGKRIRLKHLGDVTVVLTRKGATSAPGIRIFWRLIRLS